MRFPIPRHPVHGQLNATPRRDERAASIPMNTAPSTNPAPPENASGPSKRQSKWFIALWVVLALSHFSSAIWEERRTVLNLVGAISFSVIAYFEWRRLGRSAIPVLPAPCKDDTDINGSV